MMRRSRSLSIFEPALQAGYATCAHASGTAEIQPDGRWTPILMKSWRRQFDPCRDSRQGATVVHDVQQRPNHRAHVGFRNPLSSLQRQADLAARTRGITMRKLVSHLFISLDGVVEAPNTFLRPGPVLVDRRIAR